MVSLDACNALTVTIDGPIYALKGFLTISS
jgi:hypothetical protein